MAKKLVFCLGALLLAAGCGRSSNPLHSGSYYCLADINGVIQEEQGNSIDYIDEDLNVSPSWLGSDCHLTTYENKSNVKGGDGGYTIEPTVCSPQVFADLGVTKILITSGNLSQFSDNSVSYQIQFAISGFANGKTLTGTGSCQVCDD